MFRAIPLVCLIVPALLWTSCQSKPDQVDTSEPLGKNVYRTNCKLCHGANGQLGLNGASDLSNSGLPKDQVVDIITHGRNMMQPFKSLLSTEEIDAVSEYILTLRTEP